MTEPRTLYPLVVFNRPPLGLTAGQKEGIIPLDYNPAATATSTTSTKVVDFRAKMVPADVELPQPKAPAGDAEDPKVADSSVTDSASESDDESSPSGGTSTPTESLTTNPPSSSAPQETSASAEKEAPATTPALPVRTIGGATPPVETTGKDPSATS